MQQNKYDNYTLILELDIQNLDSKICDFVENHAEKFRLEADLLTEKYINRVKQINVREHSKVHKCSMKKVNDAMEKAERKLYNFLLSFV